MVNDSPRQTCDVCRDRKVRCDRAEPKCSRCLRLKLPCGYSGRRGQLSQESLQKQLAHLQNRLAKAEELLASREPTRSSNVLPSAADVVIGFEPAGDLSSQTLLSVTLARTPLLSVQETFDKDMDLEGELAGESSQTLLENYALDNLDLFGGFEDDPGAMSGTTMNWSQHSAPIYNPFLEPVIPNPIPQSTVFPSLAHSASPGTAKDSDIAFSELQHLHSAYFKRLHGVIPFVNEKRFQAELPGRNGSAAIKAVCYAVAMMGCTVSPGPSGSRDRCYQLARCHAELAEMELDDGGRNGFALFQALILILWSEIVDSRLTTAWMTLGRCIRIAKLLGLDAMDSRRGQSTPRPPLRLELPPTQDPLVLEEWRRSFWALYILESYIRTRTGMEFGLGDGDSFEICLPSPGNLDQGFSPIQMPHLSEISDKTCPELSSYAGCVLMVQLALHCFQYARHGGSPASGSTSYQSATSRGASCAPGFWDEHYRLTKVIHDRYAMLQMHLSTRSISEDPIAFSIYMNLRATEIFFHQAAIAQIEKQDLPRAMASDSQRRSSAAAFKIVSAARLNLTQEKQGAYRDIFILQRTFITWPIVMAIKALYPCLSSIDGLPQPHQDPPPNSKGGSKYAASNIMMQLRFLFDALDQAENVGGYWHSTVSDIATTMQGWETGSGITE